MTLHCKPHHPPSPVLTPDGEANHGGHALHYLINIMFQLSACSCTVAWRKIDQVL